VYIVCVNVLPGINYYGPFVTNYEAIEWIDEAIEWIDEAFPASRYIIVRLIAPD